MLNLICKPLYINIKMTKNQNRLLQLIKSFKKVLYFTIASSLFSTVYAPIILAERIDKISNNLDVKSDISLQKDNYIIGPGDILSLKIFNMPEMNQNLNVINDGTISIPFIGPIYVQGLIIEEAQILIKKTLSKELISPEIQLNLIFQRPIKISLVGEVESPGLYSLTSQEETSTEGGPSLSLSGVPTVIDAIQMAGGITNTANLKKVILKRKLKGSNFEYKQTRLNLMNLLLEGDQSQNPFLFDGDTIIIEKDNELNLDTLKIAKANFSPKTIKVYIVGEVKKPGIIEVDSRTLLTQSIYFAGGPTDWRTKRQNIQIVRLNENGTVERKKYKLDLSKPISEESNPPLQSRDIVLVGKTNFAKGTDAIKTIADPVTGLVNIITLYKLIGDL